MITVQRQQATGFFIVGKGHGTVTEHIVGVNAGNTDNLAGVGLGDIQIILGGYIHPVGVQLQIIR